MFLEIGKPNSQAEKDHSLKRYLNGFIIAGCITKKVYKGHCNYNSKIIVLSKCKISVFVKIIKVTNPVIDFNP